MLKNVVFYYPSKRIGGAQLLFHRCADWLTKISELTVFYVDYEDGYIKNHNQNENIIFVDNKKLIIPAESVVIMPLTFLLRCNGFFNLEDVQLTKYLFWSIHPLNLTAAFLIKDRFVLPYLFKIQARKRLVSLIDKGLIRFMDYQNYHSLCSSFCIPEQDIVYLPIPFGDGKGIVQRPIINGYSSEKKELSFLWLSRLMPDKLSLILTLFDELDLLETDRSIVLHIVGDGDCEEVVAKESLNHKYKTILHGRVSGDDLDSLIDTIDIGVAVGTSALEIAKRCKPVIVGVACKRDEKNRKISNNAQKQYILLSQQIGFTVGAPVAYTPGQKPFANLVQDIISAYDSKAYDCWNYIQQKHSIDKVGEFLLAGIMQCYSVNADDMNKDLYCLKKTLFPIAKFISKLRKIVS